jgi:alpha-1,2-mannosyltransferase
MQEHDAHGVGTSPGGPLRPRWSTALVGAAVAFVVLGSGLQAWRTQTNVNAGNDRVDFRVFWATAHVASEAGDVYGTDRVLGHYPYLYPVFLASALRPFTALRFQAGVRIWNLLQLVLVVVCFALLVRLLADLGAIAPAPLAAIALVLAYDPIVDNFQWVQVNLLVLALVLGALLAAVRGRALGFGLILGVAASVKLVPAALLLLLPFLGWRRAWLALGGFLGSVAICVWLVPGLLGGFGWATEMGRAFLAQTFAAGDGTSLGIRWGENCANHSLYGALKSLFGSCGPRLGKLEPATIVALYRSLVLGVVLLTLTTLVLPAVARRRGGASEPLWALAVAQALLVACLATPITWTHHWVLLIPAVALLAHTAWERGPVAPRGLLPTSAALLLAATFVASARLEGISVGTTALCHLAVWGIVTVALWQVVLRPSYFTTGQTETPLPLPPR